VHGFIGKDDERSSWRRLHGRLREDTVVEEGYDKQRQWKDYIESNKSMHCEHSGGSRVDVHTMHTRFVWAVALSGSCGKFAFSLEESRENFRD